MALKKLSFFIHPLGFFFLLLPLCWNYNKVLCDILSKTVIFDEEEYDTKWFSDCNSVELPQNVHPEL